MSSYFAGPEQDVTSAIDLISNALASAPAAPRSSRFPRLAGSPMRSARQQAHRIGGILHPHPRSGFLGIQTEDTGRNLPKRAAKANAPAARRGAAANVELTAAGLRRRQRQVQVAKKAGKGSGAAGAALANAVAKGVGNTMNGIGAALSLGGAPAGASSATSTSANNPATSVDLNSILSGLGLSTGQLNNLLAQESGNPISIANKQGQPTEIGALINAMSQPYGPGLGQQIAAAQYDPIIAAIQTQQQVQGRQAAQNMADIANWYGQVQQAAQQAISGDAAISKGAAASDQAIANSLAASIGGSANPASANVATAGANNAAFSNAITSSQAQYDNLIPSLLKQDQAGVSQRETAINQAAALNLAMQLAQNQGLEKSTALQLQNQFDSANRQMAAQKLQALMGIKQYNSGLAQEKAKNTLSTKLALAQMAEAAPSLGLKAAASEAGIAKTYASIQHMSTEDKIALKKLQMTGTMDAAHYQLMKSEILKNLNSLNPKAKTKNSALSVSLITAANDTANALGIGNDRRLKPGMGGPPRLAQVIGSVLRGRKLTPGSPEYRNIAYSLMSMFYLSDGRPIKIPKTWFTGK